MKSTSGKIKVQRVYEGFYVGTYKSKDLVFDIFVEKKKGKYFADVKQDKDIRVVFGRDSIKNCLDVIEKGFLIRGYK